MDFSVETVQLRADSFLLAGEEISSFEQTDIESELQERLDFQFECEWLDEPNPTYPDVENFLLR